MTYTRFFSNKWAIAGFTCLLYSKSFSAFGSEIPVLKVGNPVKGELSYSNSESIKPQPQPQPQSKSLDIKVPCDKGDYLAGYVDSGDNTMTMDIIDATGKLSRRLIDHKTGKQKFYSVAENCAEIWRLSGIGEYQIVLEQRVSLAEQDLEGSLESHLESSNALLSPKVSALRESLQKGQSSDGFWANVEALGTPLIEETPSGTLMTFLARGDYRNIKLMGGPSNNHDALQRLADSDTWYKSFIVPNNTHLSYQIAPNVPQLPLSGRARRIAIKAVAQADPYNHHPWPHSAIDKYATKSTVTLKDAPKNPWLDVQKETPKGELSTFKFTSSILDNTRDITIYSPAIDDSQNNRDDAVLLYIFDAESYIDTVGLPTILDNLIEEGEIPPVTAVFISNPDGDARARELPANPVFADVLANELVPQVNKRLPVAIPKDRTVIAGSSYGGLAATTIALRHPDIFGNVISMSGSFWWKPEDQAADDKHFVASEVIRMDKAPVRFFMSAGVFETARGESSSNGILGTNRHLRDVLLAKGYYARYEEYGAGHDYFSWRGIIADGLISLFGSKE
ncbi:alpha/beta hydrolase-fold protein [Psychrobacter fozii]|uniref:Enterochelin esterase family protein n=1 Tax=Psychrobacter fozii TaxID=198480 RepID=A0A2V4UDK3_9GAMM|nr:alpha/beta hydrolase-fold protein [Psychrobacter fozii]PYE38257.1 enterochelin esterase family protein [Psychrobacter fozii]